MTISDSQKVDFLWKRDIFGVTETNITGKQGYNETIASSPAIFPSKIWVSGNSIPTPAPGSTGAIVQYYNPLQMTADPTVGNNTAWLATTTFGTISSQVGNWVPPSYDPTYLVNVYSNSGLTNQLNQGTTGFEWVFDYNSGTLYFPNSLPAGVTTIYLVGYRYIGQTGLSPSGSSSKNYVVANIAARNALTPNIGDQVFVEDASGDLVLGVGPGVNATYIWNGTAYVLLGTSDSAISESKTQSITLNGASSSSTIPLGSTVNNVARAVEVVVDVTSVFDGTSTVTIGDSANNARLMDIDLNNLQQLGSYVTNPTYLFPSGTNTQINVYYDNIGSTTGTAIISITYA